MALIIKQFNNIINNFINAYYVIFKSLINQYSDLFTNLDKLLKIYKYKYGMIVVIITWLLMVTIITQSFLSVLLNMYFNLKSVPLVSTLTDVVVNDQAHVITNMETAKRLIKSPYLKPYHNIIKHIMNKHIQYKVVLDKTIGDTSIYNVPILNELINGHAIIVVNSFFADTFKQLFWKFSNKFIISKHKYFQNYLFYVLHKKSQLSNEFNFV